MALLTVNLCLVASFIPSHGVLRKPANIYSSSVTSASKESRPMNKSARKDYSNCGVLDVIVDQTFILSEGLDDAEDDEESDRITSKIRFSPLGELFVSESSDMAESVSGSWSASSGSSTEDIVVKLILTRTFAGKFAQQTIRSNYSAVCSVRNKLAAAVAIRGQEDFIENSESEMMFTGKKPREFCLYPSIEQYIE